MKEHDAMCPAAARRLFGSCQCSLIAETRAKATLRAVEAIKAIDPTPYLGEQFGALWALERAVEAVQGLSDD